MIVNYLYSVYLCVCSVLVRACECIYVCVCLIIYQLALTEIVGRSLHHSIEFIP